MGDFGIGSGYDPDFSGASGDVDMSALDTGGGYDPGADSSMAGYDPGLAEGLFSMGGGDAASDYSDYGGGVQGDDVAQTGADWAIDDWAGPYSAGSGLDAGAGALATMARGLVGPNGYLYDTRPNIGVGPDVSLRSEGGSIMPVPVGPIAPRSMAAALLKQIARNIGHRVSLAAAVSLIFKLGWQAASQALGVPPQGLMALVVAKRTSHRGRLGPHLRTIERRCRQADGYRRRIAKLAGKVHAHRTSSGSGYFPRRHRRRRSRR